MRKSWDIYIRALDTTPGTYEQHLNQSSQVILEV
jgi:hypothetical protein